MNSPFAVISVIFKEVETGTDFQTLLKKIQCGTVERKVCSDRDVEFYLCGCMVGWLKGRLGIGASVRCAIILTWY